MCLRDVGNKHVFESLERLIDGENIKRVIVRARWEKPKFYKSICGVIGYGLAPMYTCNRESRGVLGMYDDST